MAICWRWSCLGKFCNILRPRRAAFLGMSDGFILLRADSNLLRTMKHAADCMNRYPNPLRDLGK